MKKSLLLASSYEPITFIGERKCISLLLRKKAEPVSYWGEEDLFFDKSENKGQKHPAILRLVEWHNHKFKIPKFNPKVVFIRDEFKCQYCSNEIVSKDVTIDHIIPRVQGGKNSWKNCVTSCKKCNNKKGHSTLKKSGMQLIRQPITPSLNHYWKWKFCKDPEYSNYHSDWISFVNV